MPPPAASLEEGKDMPYDPLDALRRIDPEMMKHLWEQNEFVYADGALPRKQVACHLGGVCALCTACAGLTQPE
jgi:hypothetical protein